MSLSAYRRKRDFERTGEPAPTRRAGNRRPLFVVQLHHASHRHYDFRLQVGAALKSWAVPKGPSFDPKVKRLAVEVEDHPLAYADFEGDIPHDQYGGGHVAIFDHGYWSTEADIDAQLRKGHLEFELFGERLRGRWHLVRSGRPAAQPQWLLIKADDAHAGPREADDLLAGVTPPPAPDARRARRPGGDADRAPGRQRAADQRVAPLRTRVPKSRLATPADSPAERLRPGPFVPQLAISGERPPVGAQWLHELKWDGYRLLATIVAGQVQLYSRNALDWTERLPDIVAALRALPLRHAQLDGELIAGRGGREDFNRLQATLAGDQAASLRYVLFDLLHLDDADLRGLPLLERKQLLARLLDPLPPHLGLSTHIPVDGAAALALAGSQGFEGIVSKRADRPYVAGRGDDWRKSKLAASDEYAVVGYTPPRGQRSGFGSLLLARWSATDREWVYAGRVGSGFADTQLAQVAAELARARTSPRASVRLDIAHDPGLDRALWFAPRFVVEVWNRGMSRQGLLRQPSLKGLRPDKEIAMLRLPSDRPDPVAATTKRNAPVRLSHPERVVYPDLGLTKADVFAYYEAAMPLLLPGIVGRPLSILRCPEGVGTGDCFFQKHLGAGLKRVDRVRITEDSGKRADYLVVNDADGVLELVQFNALEFHPWGARADDVDRADRIVFDLDPANDVPFARVRAAARLLRERLDGLGLRAFVRTSGGKGLHVVVPLAPGCPWPQVKGFARGLAELLAQEQPEQFLSVASKARRAGRIFIDWLRNSRGATSVASWSLRARPGAPVAMSLTWEQLGRIKSPADGHLTRLRRVFARGLPDPWVDLPGVRQDLSRWAGGCDGEGVGPRQGGPLTAADFNP